jgi:predicted acyltransferase
VGESVSNGGGLAGGSGSIPPGRLMSLDALRGFDMFWIVGGAMFVRAVAAAMNPRWGEVLARLGEHPYWNGYTPWDQIFPLFMFIVGVAIPYSLGKRIERGEGGAALYWRIIRRGLILVLLGMIYNGLLRFDFANQRYPSALGRIGLTYMFAALIALHSRARGQVLAIVGLLVGYWAVMKYVPVPGYGPGDWTPGHTLAGYIDRLLIPGVLYEKVRDPEGI